MVIKYRYILKWGWIFLIIDLSSKTPLYLQLYENFKIRIVKGEYKSGDKLPSKRGLADSLGISLNTVSKAYYLLEEEGFILAKERSGYFVEQLNNSYSIKEEKESLIFESKEEVNIKYDFSSSSIAHKEFPFYTFSKLYRKIIDSEDENILINSESLGKYDFRLAISKYLKNSRGLITDPENIVISSGMEYLFEMLFYMISKDSVFGIENPGYGILPGMISSRGFFYKSIDVEEDGVSLSSLKKSGANILNITPSHQFPTGSIMPISKRLKILDWANSSENNYIIEDDYDTEFRYVGKPIDPLKSLDTNDKVIYMGSFSKSIAPSLRISYMILPNRLMNILKQDVPFFICSVPVIDQMVMAEFLEKGHFERHLNKMRRIYKKHRESLINELSKYPQVLNISGADSGIHIVVTLKTEKDDQEIVSACLKKGIRIQALSEFYNSSKTSSSKFILGFGSLNKESISKGVKGIIETI